MNTVRSLPLPILRVPCKLISVKKLLASSQTINMALFLPTGSGKDALSFMTGQLGIPLKNFSPEILEYFAEEPRFTFYFCLVNDIANSKETNPQQIILKGSDYNRRIRANFYSSDHYYVTKPAFISNYHLGILLITGQKSSNHEISYRMSKISRSVYKKSPNTTLCFKIIIKDDGKIDEYSGNWQSETKAFLCSEKIQKESLNSVTDCLNAVTSYWSCESDITYDWDAEFFHWTRKRIHQIFLINLELFKPLRMTVKSTSQINFKHENGFFISAKIETGVLSYENDPRILVFPMNTSFTVVDIRHNAEIREFSRPGDIVEIQICVEDRKDFSRIAKGDFICSPRCPVPNFRRQAN